MKEKIEQLIEAVDDRTGIPSGIKHFLNEEIPASSGWHQVFGSVALFMILIQFFTGAMLAFNYAPTPGDSYNSLRYILTEVTGLEFRNAWKKRVPSTFFSVPVHFISLDDLVTNKQALGRSSDLKDLGQNPKKSKSDK